MINAPPTTPAQTYLLQQQRRYPPRYPKLDGLDRAQQLFRVLAISLPESLKNSIANGTVTIGEIGRNVPYVRAVPLGSGNFVVEFTSGMMDFQYAVARALTGLDSSNVSQKPLPLRKEVIARLVRKVLLQWSRYMRWSIVWPRPKVEIPNVQASQSAVDFFELVATAGELFMLAHELGHIALNGGLVGQIYGNEEMDADFYGLQFLLPAAETKWHKRVAYGSPVFAIRFLASLERLGVRFAEQYPPEAERMRMLREQIRKLCPSQQYFFEVSTIMVAWQDMLDDIDNLINPKSPRTFPDVDRVSVRLIAELEEVARGNITLEKFIEHIGNLGKVYPHETVSKAMQYLLHDYIRPPQEGGTFISIQLRVLMTLKLAELVAQVPPDLKHFFPNPDKFIEDWTPQYSAWMAKKENQP